MIPEKNQRLKEAKEEAGLEIETYRKEREVQFNEKKKNYDGSKDDFQKRMETDKLEKFKKIEEDVATNQGKVVQRLLDMVYDIKPELHRNMRIEQQ